MSKYFDIFKIKDKDQDVKLFLSKFNIQAEMNVVKNCILQSKSEKINYDTLKKYKTKNVFPNLYKLLQLAMSLSAQRLAKDAFQLYEK